MEVNKKSLRCKLGLHKNWMPIIIPHGEEIENEIVGELSGRKCLDCGHESRGCGKCGYKKLQLRHFISRVFTSPSKIKCPRCGYVNVTYDYMIINGERVKIIGDVITYRLNENRMN